MKRFLNLYDRMGLNYDAETIRVNEGNDCSVHMETLSRDSPASSLSSGSHDMNNNGGADKTGQLNTLNRSWESFMSKDIDSDNEDDDCMVLDPYEDKDKEIFVVMDKSLSEALNLSTNDMNSVVSRTPVKQLRIRKSLYSRNSPKIKSTQKQKPINDDENLVASPPKSKPVSNESNNDGATLSDNAPDSVYEVEAILDFICEENTDYYFVKWKGWTDDDNTWEPESNLEGCQRLIKKFHQLNPFTKELRKRHRLKNGFYDTRTGKQKKMDHFLRKNARLISVLFKELSQSSINGTCKKIKTNSMISRFLNSFSDDHTEIRYSVTMPEGIRRISMTGAKFKRFMELKKITEEKLKDWQDEINKVSTDPAPIVVINEVDLEYAPENFVYINDYEAGEGIAIPDDPLVGCDCNDCHKDQTNCCGHQSGGSFAYTKHKKLKVLPGSPIYECNKRCLCGPECINRVVQHGRKMKLAIFRTTNKCGWGVKTLEPIPKGTFVMEYVGEVITEQEAEQRGHKYDAEGRTYLFDLDYDDSDCPFTVDAAYVGNISHFMNHSCEPNLAVYGVWINSLDPRLPRLAFFSTREIKRGEELNFDYMMSAGGKDADTSINKTKSPQTPPPKLSTVGESQKRIHCKCGSNNCRKYLF